MDTQYKDDIVNELLQSVESTTLDRDKLLAVIARQNILQASEITQIKLITQEGLAQAKATNGRVNTLEDRAKFTRGVMYTLTVLLAALGTVASINQVKIASVSEFVMSEGSRIKQEIAIEVDSKLLITQDARDRHINEIINAKLQTK